MKKQEIAALVEDIRSIFGTAFSDLELQEAPSRSKNSKKDDEASFHGHGFSRKVKDTARERRGEDERDRARLAHAKSIGAAADKHRASQSEPEKVDPRAALRKLDRERDQKDMSPHSDKVAAMHGGGGGGGGGGSAGAKNGKRSEHYPFSQSPNLGQGPLGKYHDEKKCWICSCGNIYTDGCWCFGNPRNRSCKDNKPKRIRIKRSYRKWYNGVYHKWRRDQRGQVTARNQQRGAARRTG